jgi:sugar phosphate permease
LTFFFVDAGANDGRAAIYAAFFPLGAVLGNLVVGLLYDRLSSKLRGVLIGLFSAGSIVSGVLLFLCVVGVFFRLILPSS